MVTLDMYAVESIQIQNREFPTFNVYQISLIDSKGEKTVIRAFTQERAHIEIEHLPVEDNTK